MSNPNIPDIHPNEDAFEASLAMAEFDHMEQMENERDEFLSDAEDAQYMEDMENYGNDE